MSTLTFIPSSLVPPLPCPRPLPSPPAFEDNLVRLPSSEEFDRRTLDWQPPLGTSLCQRSAEDDHWYLDTLTDPRLSRRLLGFVESHWGFYVANSGRFRYSPSLEALEAEFQSQFGCQSWETVRPRIYSSACVYGLRHYVETWTSAYPRLARTMQHFPSATTALMEVCANEKGQPEIAKILIDNGAEIQRVPRMLFGSPLCVSIRQGHEAIARLLLDKDRRLIKDPAVPLFSPLYWAFNQAHDVSNTVPLVRMLLDYGGNVNRKCSPFRDQSPLNLAARSFTPGFIELLTERGAFIDSRNGEHGMTPLMVAVRNGIPENCKLLLAQGADVHLKDMHRSSVLHFAIEHEETTVAKMILDSGIDIDAVDGGGFTALHRNLSHQSGANHFAELLIRNNIDLSAKMIDGRTALHYASSNGKWAIVVLLLARGASPDVVDNDGGTPLHLAAQCGHAHTVEYLIGVTNDIDTQNIKGHTALSLAATEGHHAIVKALLIAGAKISPQEPGPQSHYIDPDERVEWYGLDALLGAYRNNNQSIVHLLLEFGAERDPSEYREGLRLWNQDVTKRTTIFEEWLDHRAARTESPEIVALVEIVSARHDSALHESIVRFRKKLGRMYVADYTSSESGSESAIVSGGDFNGSSDDGGGVDTAEPESLPPL